MRAGTRRTLLARHAAAAAPASEWWEVAGKTTLRAYQPKGAASYAASLTDLAGTLDAAEGTAPDWDASNGWKFAAGSLHYLTTGLTADDAETYVIRFSNSGSGDMRSGAGACCVYPDWYGNALFQRRGGTLYAGDEAYTAGTIALSGQQSYKNGVALGAALDNTLERDWPVLIGAMSDGDGSLVSKYCTWYVQAWVAIAEALDGTEMAALHAAMAAL